MSNLPPAFESRMKKQLGQEAAAFFNALNQPAPVSIRLNPIKTTGKIPDTLQSIVDKKTEWCPEGYFLSQRPVFTLDPCYQGGAYYVQEAASMFIGYLLKQIIHEQPVKVLDLCAAPGGKSSLTVSALPADSLLVSNEVIRPRATILKENMLRWGYSNVIVTNNDPSDFSAFESAFDIVIVDAPCSGEGMFRKDPASIGEWSENNLTVCRDRQKRILADIWKTLKPDGYLIYSTCTYNPGENEEILEWICRQFQAESIPVSLPTDTITPGNSTAYGYHFYPHKTTGEGFFCGLIRKKDGEEYRPKKNKKQKATTSPIPPELSRLLIHPENLTAQNEDNRITILPGMHGEFIRQLRSELKVMAYGCEAAELYNRKIKLLHPLALTTWLNKQACCCYEAELPEALRYLKKEDIQINAKTGEWILITYRHIALGWGKNLGNRLNNYLPKEWRIRMDLPTDLI